MTVISPLCHGECFTALLTQPAHQANDRDSYPSGLSFGHMLSLRMPSSGPSEHEEERNIQITVFNS